jgi:hypothetical protein
LVDERVAANGEKIWGALVNLPVPIFGRNSRLDGFCSRIFSSDSSTVAVPPRSPLYLLAVSA